MSMPMPPRWEQFSQIMPYLEFSTNQAGLREKQTSVVASELAEQLALGLHTRLMLSHLQQLNFWYI